MSQDARSQGNRSQGNLGQGDSAPRAPDDVLRDAVDVIIDEWRRERPDLDPSAKAITGRIVRLAAFMQDRMGEAAAAHGLSNGGFGILAALRRSGPPFQLTPSELTRHLMVTTGGMTTMIDRLEAHGFVRRAPNPADRRGVLVGLTGDGLRTIEAAMEAHARVEHDLVDGLAARDRDQLARLLRILLLQVDDVASVTS
jgi:DNA-binding MarR family transcriptional regulator